MNTNFPVANQSANQSSIKFLNKAVFMFSFRDSMQTFFRKCFFFSALSTFHVQIGINMFSLR